MTRKEKKNKSEETAKSELVKETHEVESTPVESTPKQLSTTTFVVFTIIILFIGLSLTGFLYYITNIQYQNQKPKNIFKALQGPVTTKPASLTLEVGSPEDNLLTFGSSLLISGNTSESSNILISSDAEDLVVKSKSDGSFSTVIELTEGVNNISITVFDENGDQKQVEKVVYYSKEKL